MKVDRHMMPSSLGLRMTRLRSCVRPSQSMTAPATGIDQNARWAITSSAFTWASQAKNNAYPPQMV
jgi:hypothetical protein